MTNPDLLKQAFHLAIAACGGVYEGMPSGVSQDSLDDDIIPTLKSHQKITPKRRRMHFIEVAAQKAGQAIESHLYVKSFPGNFGSDEGVHQKAVALAQWIMGAAAKRGINPYTGIKEHPSILAPLDAGPTFASLAQEKLDGQKVTVKFHESWVTSEPVKVRKDKTVLAAWQSALQSELASPEDGTATELLNALKAVEKAVA